VPWRNPNTKYAKNEMFLDVIEKLNMLVGPKGTVIKSEIVGTVKAKC
jgi:AP-1 complex subunit mu